MTFDTVFIANRGEIAIRIARSARDCGLRTVGIYTEPDFESPHVLAVDTAIYLADEADGMEPYLDGGRLIEAARKSRAQAVHPGYGFLSENAEFAEACAAAGLIFIGPSPEVIRLMADKGAAKRHVKKAGVDCIPGYDDTDQSDTRLVAEAEKIGAPLLIKAVAGGGGRGMRRVNQLSDFRDALASARSEASRSFGSSDVILERALDGARHIEIQLAADCHGNTVHLGERDCSCQRRNQKVIEEAPSLFVDAALRDALGQAAVCAAASVAYTGVGTIEFLVTNDRRFYFMEMNTRLQVEHPVTEAITGQDLVAWQFRIAAGECLPLAQNEIHFTGAAIEARLYAENPAQDFRPQTGFVHDWQPPTGDGVRIDHAIADGIFVSPRYDPMLAKVIAFGDNREAARVRLMTALGALQIQGLTTNRMLLLSLLDHADFRLGVADTQFCERVAKLPPAVPTPSQMIVAAAIEYRRRCFKWSGSPDGWSSLGRMPRLFLVSIGGKECEFRAFMSGSEIVIAGDDSDRLSVVTFSRHPQGEVARLNGETQTFQVYVDDETVDVAFGSLAVRIDSEPSYGRTAPSGDGRDVHAPMSGRILRILKAVGDVVEAGEAIIVLEAMKMEFSVRAGRDGSVEMLATKPGDQVADGDFLARIAD